MNCKGTPIVNICRHPSLNYFAACDDGVGKDGGHGGPCRSVPAGDPARATPTDPAPGAQRPAEAGWCNADGGGELLLFCFNIFNIVTHRRANKKVGATARAAARGPPPTGAERCWRRRGSTRLPTEELVAATLRCLGAKVSSSISR